MPLKWYRRLTVFTSFAVWALIVLGGSVRVTDSGTGCGNSWPMCDGHLLPALEYHQLVEWNHRLFATLVGGLMIVTVGSTLLWFRQPRRLLWLAVLAGATYITQAILGGITVLLHLDHTWVAAHMGNSMILLGSLVLLAVFARRQSAGVSRDSLGQEATGGVVSLGAEAPLGRLRSGLVNLEGWLGANVRWLTIATLLCTYAAMLTGSAVVGASADVACPAWPQCGPNQLLPVTGDEWVNFGHRMAVGLSDVLMLVLAATIWRTRRSDNRLMRAAHVLALLYVSQVFLGAFTIWLQAPELLKGAHLALAAATWAALVALSAFVWMGRGGSKFRVQDTDYPVRGRQSPAVNRPSPVVYRVSSSMSAYLGLIKPRVIPLLLVPTVAAMLMAAVQHPAHRPLLGLIILTMLGGTLAAGGAHAVNQYWDRDIDARMKRTRNRAVVTGEIPAERALIFGVVLSALAFVELWLTVNLLAGLLAIAGNLFYIFVYTMWLKRTSVQNIVIGGAAGAVPPLVGWAAVTGRVDIPALLFFAIIFFWTPPHFWALALVRHRDYEAAGVPMLPVVRGGGYTRRNIVVYAAVLVVVTLLPYALNALGWLYLVVALGLGLLFMLRAIELERRASIAHAWKLFKFSNIYLALLYLAMVVDRLLALGTIHIA